MILPSARAFWSGNSKTHRSFESINSSGLTSFHCNKIKCQFGKKIAFWNLYNTLTNCSELNSPSGATTLWTINLCLFFSFGSKSNGCKQTINSKIKHYKRYWRLIFWSNFCIVMWITKWLNIMNDCILTSYFYKIIWL